MHTKESLKKGLLSLPKIWEVRGCIVSQKTIDKGLDQPPSKSSVNFQPDLFFFKKFWPPAIIDVYYVYTLYLLQ